MAAYEWTEDKLIKLIRLFKNKPVLWDPKETFYYKPSVKSDCWAAIAAEMETSAEECRRKMTILMSSFRREKSKILNNMALPRFLRPDDQNPYRSTWFAFKEMAFLLNKNRSADDEEEDGSLMHSIMKYHVAGQPNQTKGPTKTFRPLLSDPNDSTAVDESNTNDLLRKTNDNSETEEESQTTKTTEFWTESKTITLIRAYKARDVLWNVQNRLFYKKYIKEKAWKEIGQEMGIHPEDCRRKLSIVLSSFRREKSRLLRSLVANQEKGEELYRSNWYAFSELMFLLERPQHKGLLQNLEDIVQPQNKQAKSTTEETIITPLPLSPAAGCSTDCYDPLQTVTTNANCNEEEIRSFTNFVAMKMMKYNETQKNAVQQEICRIIFEEDRKMLEGSNAYYGGDVSHCQESLASKNVTDDSIDNIMVKVWHSDSE